MSRKHGNLLAAEVDVDEIPTSKTPEQLGCPPFSADEPLDFVFEGPWGDDPPHLYVYERLVLTEAALENFQQVLADYLAAVSAVNWTRALKCSQITGDPRNLVQIWRVPARRIDSSLIALRGRPDYQAVLKGIARLERQVLFPMPYDPAAVRAHDEKNAGPGSRREGRRDTRMSDPPKSHEESHDQMSSTVCLLDRISVKKGAMRRFAWLKQRTFIPAVAPEGWSLVLAASTTTGPAATVLQCWALRDSNALLTCMKAMSQNGDYRKYLAPCIEQEHQDLYEPLW